MATSKKELAFDKEANKNLSKTKAELTGINKNKGEEIRLRRNLDVLEKEKRANFSISKSQELAMKTKLEKFKKLKNKISNKTASPESDSDEDIEMLPNYGERRRSTVSTRPSSAIYGNNVIMPSTSAGQVKDAKYDMYGRRNTCTSLGIKPDKLKELAGRTSGSSSREQSPSRYRPSSGSGMKRSVTDTRIGKLDD
ncbi:hypothetical protein TrispH2_004015 [Trichoplax sp. H2]|uniref:Uncharacterized protein n=1 Tax=Trichoplax adhaerens TaxID=10228 RepID=B3RNU5_TRIAD|nr:predicted protein [Trichoplax adhaerens]EDV27524.1 predicted protein [Trichoplax adhaerens]RDD43352.1 hypothetical protein TrispH2_004015 [Trichoplax sp. H2]|eukprot:XP_002109358.1 predicted protein [Trichoplax adhaerens]